jgi:hypothetical protein
MTQRARRFALRIPVFAALLVAGASLAHAASGDREMPTHGPTQVAFGRFVVDQLPELVKGKTFDWKGHHYEVTELHHITKSTVQRSKSTDRNADVAVNGWTWALVHVRVDGRLMRARVEGSARYSRTADGWEWDHVLMYLGLNDSYDFATGEIR